MAARATRAATEAKVIPALLTRLLGAPEEINGADRCPTYMYRWVVLSTRWFKVYVHRFVADDWSRDLHDHPKRFVSIGLWGRYTEHGPGGRRREYRAPWIRTFPASHIHRITLPRACGGCGTPEGHAHRDPLGCYIPLFLPLECWTLIVVGRPVREWGFWHEEPAPWFVLGRQARHWRWVPWHKYVRSLAADERKACS